MGYFVQASMLTYVIYDSLLPQEIVEYAGSFQNLAETYYMKCFVKSNIFYLKDIKMYV